MCCCGYPQTYSLSKNTCHEHKCEIHVLKGAIQLPGQSFLYILYLVIPTPWMWAFHLVWGSVCPRHPLCGQWRGEKEDTMLTPKFESREGPPSATEPLTTDKAQGDHAAGLPGQCWAVELPLTTSFCSSTFAKVCPSWQSCSNMHSSLCSSRIAD